MQSLRPDAGVRYRNVVDALRQIVRTEGLWRPVRGVNIMAAGAGPAHAMYFACYEKIKFSLSNAIHPGANSHFANGTFCRIASGYGVVLLTAEGRSACIKRSLLLSVQGRFLLAVHGRYGSGTSVLC